jgi:hypothetical protein
MAKTDVFIEINDKPIVQQILSNEASSCRRLLILNEKLLSASPEDSVANVGVYEEAPKS